MKGSAQRLVLMFCLVVGGCGRDEEPQGMQRLVGYTIHELKLPRELVAGEKYPAKMNITNTGEAVWRAESTIVAGWHLFDETGKRGIRFGNEFTTFDQHVLPGQTVDQNVTIVAPETPGDYVIEVDLHHIGIFWFEDYGATPGRVSVTVVE